MDTLPPSDRTMPPLAARFLEPVGFQWGKFVTSHGATLRCGHLPNPQADKSCVLVGGFAEFIEKYFETAQDFAARGFEVWCLDWHGQGASERPGIHPSRPFARNYGQDADDLAHFITKMTPRGRPRLLVAHSMGGAIGLLCLHRHPKVADAAVLSAPMLALPMGTLWHGVARGVVSLATAAGRAHQFIPGAGPWKARDVNPQHSRTSHDPERCLLQRTWFEHQPHLRVDGPTYGWVSAAFRVMSQLRDAKFLSSVKTPILLGSAAKEFFVSPRAHRLAAAKLPACKLVEFPSAKHELFHEADDVRVPWFAAIDAFVAEHISGRTHG
jgi:lysophospholipase